MFGICNQHYFIKVYIVQGNSSFLYYLDFCMKSFISYFIIFSGKHTFLIFSYFFANIMDSMC